MFVVWHFQEGSTIDYPMGGGKAIISALIRGLEKYGGRLLLRAHVDEVMIDPPAAAFRVWLCALPRESQSNLGTTGHADFAQIIMESGKAAGVRLKQQGRGPQEVIRSAAVMPE